MPRKKTQPPDQLAALRRVRKALPPPSRAGADEKKYRRAAVRRAMRAELEREAVEE
jgi:hypothetical protein